MTKSIIQFLSVAFLLSGCVSAGYEGQVGTMLSNDQIRDQRVANKTIMVFESVPDGYSAMDSISVRRCHRSFSEAKPSQAALITDLKIAAYAAGGDAISNITTEQKNGLAANCWYVIEATANVWEK